MNDIKSIVSFSGGKDSTAMLLMMIEKDYPIDEIIFVDTGKEFPQMYNHIDQVEQYIKRPITRLNIDFEYWFANHIKTKGKNKGKKGYGWPDFNNRWCTRLKLNAIEKHINIYRKQGFKVLEHVGIAFDEPERIKTKDYPLYLLEITEQQALDYCYSKGFDWEGLYKKFHRVSCYCCPLSRLEELRTVYSEFPDLWADMKELDKHSFRTFKYKTTLKQLENRFSKEVKQLNLFNKEVCNA